MVLLSLGRPRVIHVTPSYFDEESIVGGGERYPGELAYWMSKRVDTTLVSFSSKRKTLMRGDLRIEVFPVSGFIKGNKADPVSLAFLSLLFQADIVHSHQVSTFVSQMAGTVSSLMFKRAYVTDYGGGAGFVRKINDYFPILSCYRKAFAYSDFGRAALPRCLQPRAVLVKGGIDTVRFHPVPGIPKEPLLLFVGRILPHKGINYLIEAFRLIRRTGFRLRIIGRVYHEDFYRHLKKISEGLDIEFIHNADDALLLDSYRTAHLTVLPSVATDMYGGYTAVPELMGFTLLESQACGTPVVCTDAGAMSEFVDHGRTGYVVGQNSPEELADAMEEILAVPDDQYRAMQLRCRALAEGYSWDNVVAEYLKVYTS
mgnify:CR=1 FL=1